MIPIVRSLALAATATAGIAAADAIPPIEHPLQEHADSVLLVDQQRVFAGAALAKPTSLWADPDFAEQRAHIREQLRLMTAANQDVPPFLDILTHARSYYFAADLPTYEDADTAPNRSMAMSMAMLFAMDAGKASDAVRAWWQRTAGQQGEAATVGGIAGRELGPEMFTGLDDSVLVAGKTDLVEAWTHGGRDTGSLPADGPVGVSATRYGDLISTLATLAEYDPEVDPMLSALLGSEWRGSDPSLRTGTWVDAEGGWRSRVRLTGLARMPLARLTPALAAHLPETGDIRCALALSPAAALDIAVALIAADTGGSPDEARGTLAAGLQREYDVALDDLLAALTGEIGASIAWAPDAMPIPKGVTVLGLSDADTVAAALAPMLAEVAAVEAAVDGARAAWTVTAPMLQLTVAVGDDVLVLANRAELAAQALAPRAGATAPWDSDTGIHFDLAVARIGRQWLPLGLAQLGTVEQDLASHPLRSLSYTSNQVQQALMQETPPSSLSEALAENRWALQRLGDLYPDQDPGAAVDSHVAVWIRKNDAMISDTAFVLRTDAGYRMIAGWNQDDWDSAPDAAGIRAALDGRQHALGPGLEELAVTTVPEIPSFDRRWLPDPATAIRHLPERYTLAVSQRDDGSLVVDERGLPVVGNYAHAGGVFAFAMSQMLQWQIRSAREEQRKAALREEHAELIAGVEVIAEVIGQLHNGDGIPATASDLVRQGHLALADTAFLFGGRVPARADALDQVGRWTQEPEGWPRAVWAIHLEPGWSVTISPWGQVEVTDRIDVPPTPADAVAGGDEESLF